jgi:hypothetical protein
MTSSRDLLYFVGSVPLANSEAVFRTLSGDAGDYLRRIPDGETGERKKWIVFQQQMLNEHPAMEVDPDQAPFPVKQCDGTIFRHIKRVRIKPKVNPNDVIFDTGYDVAALNSYATFKKLRTEGVIASGTRFQVALPTPMATGLMYVSPNGRDRYLRAYERALLQALRKILAGVPHQDLCIQFDVCQEVLMFENYFPERDPDYKATTFQQFGRLAAAVPSDVELGFHLCYGSPNDQPLVLLESSAILVDLLNGIDTDIGRSVDFIHVPVPKHADDAFFAPMKDWRNAKGTHLYLGLLQHDDAVGDQRRMSAGRRVVRTFGVAAECGFGRTNPANMPVILTAHRRAAALLQSLL